GAARSGLPAPRLHDALPSYCDTRCEAGAVNTECPVCKTNMSECTGAVPEPEEPVEDAEAEAPEEPENASPNIALIIGIIALVGRSEEHTSELQSRFEPVCRL